MPEVKGLTTDNLLAEFSKLVPPIRPKGFGITAQETNERNHISNASYIKSLLRDMDMVCIKMRNVRGQKIHVYAKKAEAAEYKDWVIDYQYAMINYGQRSEGMS